MNVIDASHPLREVMLVGGNQVAIASDHFADSGIVVFQTKEKLRQFRCRNVCLYEKNDNIDSMSSIREIARFRDANISESSLFPTWNSRSAHRFQRLKTIENHKSMDEGRSTLGITNNSIIKDAKREKSKERESLKRFHAESSYRPEAVKKIVGESDYTLGTTNNSVVEGGGSNHDVEECDDAKREKVQERDSIKRFPEENPSQSEVVNKVVEVSDYTQVTTKNSVIEKGSSNDHEEEEREIAKREKSQQQDSLDRFLKESLCQPETVKKVVEISDYPFGSVSLIPSGSYQFAKKLQRLKAANSNESSCSLHQDDSQIEGDDDDTSTSEISETQENVMDESIIETETKTVSIPVIPGLIIMEIIGSYVNNRKEWNSLASLNRETFEISKNLTQLYRPWPSTRWRATSTTAQRFPAKGMLQGQRRRRRIARGAVQTSARPRAVAFGTDYLCYGTDRGNVIVRWVHGEGSTKVLEGHMGCVNSIQCYGNLLFSAGDDLETRIWNVKTMSCEAILKGHVGSITSIAVLPFDLCHVNSDNHDNCITLNPLISSSTSCMLVATAGLDGDIHLYTVYCRGGKVVLTEHFATFMDEFHSKSVHSVVLYEKDGRRNLISGGDDGRLRLWDVDAAIANGIGRCSNNIEAGSDTKGSATEICRSTCIFRHDGEIKSITLSPDKDRIAVAFGRTICYSKLTGKTLQNYSFLDHDHNHLRRRRRRLREEGGNNPERLVRNDIIANDDINHWEVLKGHSGDIRCVDFSSDGSTVASACTDGSIRLWMLGERTWKRKWKAHNGFMVCSLAVSPDGQSLLSAGSDGTLAIENL